MASGETRQPAIAEAMIRVAGRKGYRGATVADAIAEAGVSRTTFYKHFDDKHECFLAAFDLAAERLLAAVTAGCERELPWLERVKDGLESLVAQLADNPEPARVVIVEAPAAGAEARRRQWAMVARVAAMLDAGCEDERAKLPADTGLMATSAVAGLLFDEIQAGRAGELPRSLPELLFALLVPYLGPKDAAQQMRLAVAQPTASR